MFNSRFLLSLDMSKCIIIFCFHFFLGFENGDGGSSLVGLLCGSNEMEHIMQCTGILKLGKCWFLSHQVLNTKPLLVMISPVIAGLGKYFFSIFINKVLANLRVIYSMCYRNIYI